VVNRTLVDEARESWEEIITLYETDFAGSIWQSSGGWMPRRPVAAGGGERKT